MLNVQPTVENMFSSHVRKATIKIHNGISCRIRECSEARQYSSIWFDEWKKYSIFPLFLSFFPLIRLIQYARFKSQHSDVVPAATNVRSKLAIHTVHVVSAVSMLLESTSSLTIIASCSCTFLSTEILIEYLILEKMNENSDDDKKSCCMYSPKDDTRSKKC